MENITLDDVVKSLGQMSVMEVITLTRELEQKWGVEAKPSTVHFVSLNPVPHDEQKSIVQEEFSVVLVSYPADKKMAVIKLVKELSGLGLKEAKEFAETAPKVLREGVSKTEADDLKSKLEAAGAVAEVK